MTTLFIDETEKMRITLYDDSSKDKMVYLSIPSDDSRDNVTLFKVASLALRYSVANIPCVTHFNQVIVEFWDIDNVSVLVSIPITTVIDDTIPYTTDIYHMSLLLKLYPSVIIPYGTMNPIDGTIDRAVLEHTDLYSLNLWSIDFTADMKKWNYDFDVLSDTLWLVESINGIEYQVI